MAQSTGCSKEDSEEHGILDISDVVLLDQIYTSIGSEVSISGRGFESGDVVVLRPVLTGSAEYTAPAVLVTSTEIVFVVPDASVGRTGMIGNMSNRRKRRSAIGPPPTHHVSGRRPSSRARSP